MTQSSEWLFAGAGEVSALMRALDWSTTPIGPVEQWPQSLRTCVRIMLGCGYPMAICWSRDYILLYNDAFRPILATKHPLALGHKSSEIWGAEAWDRNEPLYDTVMTQGQDVSSLTDYLMPLYRNNYLEECYFAFSHSPIPDDKGGVGGVFTTVLETTERVIEDRRQRVHRDLASRTAETRNAEEVWRVSAETLCEHRPSAPFAFLYEYRASEHQAYLVGASVETDGALRQDPIDCRSENLWRFDPAMKRGGEVVELGNLASGVSIDNWPAPPKEASVVPIRLGEHGELAGFLVLGLHPGRAFDDTYHEFVNRIAEQIAIGLANARAYEQERQRAEALAELDRAKTAFFSNVSHEFRTPLTLMLGPLEEVLPEARERLNPERHEQLVTVRRNALRLLKLVNTLLDFSRIEAGRLQAVYEPTDLARITSEIASVFRSAMENAGLRFSVECQAIAEPVYVDHDMWEKVVLNLLSNAFKFTFEGEVAVTLKPVEGAVELQVRDTGVGIPEEHRERVFERFHRIEGIHARTYEGTGIGLALVQELVKLHGGSVRVESAPGQGSMFTVTIPTGKAHLPAERIQSTQSFASTKIQAEGYVEEARQWSGNESRAAVDMAMPGQQPLLTTLAEPTPAAERELIILADDNMDMRRYLVHLLGNLYEVHAVPDGREALEAARQFRPALVLADVMMPRLDGFGLLRAIRDDLTLAGTPVILLSARAGEESRVEGLQADADDYLVKPFAARELLARVATHVKMANLRRESAEREERLRSDAELERLRVRHLQDQEQKLRDVIETMPTFAWTALPDGSEDFVNRYWHEYSGLSLKESAGSGWQSAVHPADLKLHLEKWRSSLATGEPFENEVRYRRASDGQYRWFLARAVPLRDGPGKIVRWYGISTDIEDRKGAEQEREQLRAELAHMNRISVMGEMAASLAHEIRQPITAATTNAQICLWLLERDKLDVSEMREATSAVVQCVKRAGDIIERVRSLSRKSAQEHELVDVNQIVREIDAMLRNESSLSSVTTNLQFSESVAPVKGDRVQLQQVIMNLMVNAIEAMKGSGGELVVTTERTDRSQVVVSVSDSGVGLPEGKEERIFDAFFTTKTQGTGMGLAISRSIVESHGGRLWAKRNTGRGSTFYFELPRHEPKAA